MELQIHSFLPVSEDSIYSRNPSFSQSVGFVYLIYNFEKNNWGKEISNNELADM